MEPGRTFAEYERACASNDCEYNTWLSLCISLALIQSQSGLGGDERARVSAVGAECARRLATAVKPLGDCMWCKRQFIVRPSIDSDTHQCDECKLGFAARFAAHGIAAEKRVPIEHVWLQKGDRVIQRSAECAACARLIVWPDNGTTVLECDACADLFNRLGTIK